MSLSYADSGSGPSAGGIGWVNFENLVLNPGDSVTGITGTLKDGTTVTFDVESLSSSQLIFNAITAPAFPSVGFGGVGYTGILGNVVLQSNRQLFPTSSTIVISNIVLKDQLGNQVTNYVTIISDAESTNSEESWTFNTNGGNWNLLASLGSSLPILGGLGTQIATITPTGNATAGDYVLTTNSPQRLELTTTSNGGKEGFALGFAVTRIAIHKNIGDRIDSNDQFLLDIGGTPTDQATTSGTINGLQTEVATVFAFPDNSYTINEQMAPGSVTPLSGYTTKISVINATVGGTIPPISSLPITVTPQLGDIIVYDILNAAPQTFNKSVDKQYADLGDVITYTVTVTNPNEEPIANVLITDPIPAGTSFIDINYSNLPYTGTSPVTGITIPSLPGNSSAIISWRLKVNSTLPIFTPINNVANVTIPGGTSGSTNTVSTTISHADLASPGNFIKSVSSANANIGDIITYTLNVKNTGNTPANNVIITDSVPLGTTYVAGSTTSNVSFTGDPTTSIKLTAPLAASQIVTISFKVKIGNTIPSPNPITNEAKIDYAYTVDPTIPNSVKINGFSNSVNTSVSNATLITKKSVDKSVAYIGDTLTYNLAITNTGNVATNQVVITDPIPNGTIYVPGSLSVSTAYSGNPSTSIILTNAIGAGQTVSISFQVIVTALPNPNPIVNVSKTSYSYTVDPLNPNAIKSISTSNPASTVVFKYNFSQQITDLIESIALEQAALASIANSEGAKIQAMVAMGSITQQELLCVNKSVSDMMNSITILESILKQKLNTVDCQINPVCIQ